MRQVCNISYAVQAESLDTRTGEFQRWELALYRPPPGFIEQVKRSYVDPSLDSLMAPGR